MSTEPRAAPRQSRRFAPSAWKAYPDHHAPWVSISIHLKGAASGSGWAKGGGFTLKLAQHDAREKLENWRRDYNEVRPHSAIGYNVPIYIHNPGGATSLSPE